MAQAVTATPVAPVAVSHVRPSPSKWAIRKCESYSDYISRICNRAMDKMQHAVETPWHAMRVVSDEKPNLREIEATWEEETSDARREGRLGDIQPVNLYYGELVCHYMAKPFAFADRCAVGTLKVLDATTGALCAFAGGPLGRLAHNVFAAFMRVIVFGVAFCVYTPIAILIAILYLIVKKLLWDCVLAPLGSVIKDRAIEALWHWTVGRTFVVMLP